MGNRRNRKRGGKNKRPNESNPVNTFLEIKESQVFGRYLVAKENIKAGTQLIKAEPLAYGPDFGQSLMCINCSKVMETTETERCICEWPICFKTCSTSVISHTKPECDLLKKTLKKPSWTNSSSTLLYNIVVPLRVLLLPDTDPKKWEIVAEMESHDEERKKNLLQWDSNQRLIVDVVRRDCGLSDYSDELLHTVIGYLQVNSFSIENTGLRGLYPEAYLLLHDCVPNTSHSFDENNVITVRANVDIKKGETVTLSYANTLEGTSQRRYQLKESKYFDCTCARCSDPTELGTNLSSLKCFNCTKGYLVPVKPLDKNSLWACKSCQHTEKNRNIEMLVSKISSEIGQIKDKTIHFWENFIEKYKKVLHENHFLLLTAQHCLSQLYGKTPDFMITEMSEDQLQRKIDLCFHVLKVFDVLEPGLTRIRGVTLYEVHAPLLVLTIKKFHSKKIQKQNLVQSLKRVVQYLTEADHILSFESEGSNEGKIGKAAKHALVQAKKWEITFGRM